LGAIFLALFFVLCAGSLGGALHRFFAFDRLEATLVSVAAIAVLGLFQVLIARARDRAEFGDRVADLSRGAADLARQVAETGRRLASAEIEIARAAERTRAALEPTSAEIELLRRSAKELAESVAAHEAMLQGRNGPSAEAGPLAALSLALDAIAEPAPVVAAQGGNVGAAAQAGNGGEGACADAPQDVASVLRQAAEAGRFELYLQPIVTLPQRKVRYYVATARLRTEAGELLDPCDFARQAQCASSIAVVDDVLLFRSVQVVRRLLAKNRDVGVSCHLSGRSLLDPTFLSEVSDFIEANRALASLLVFEFAQKQVRAMGTTERECLAELAALGFRFAMHRLGDLVVEPRELAERGFRFVKIPAALLLNRAEAKASGVEAAELSDRLGRFGIDLIAEAIDSEARVVDLIDFDVRFGAGALFSPPRPVRAEIVQGSAGLPLPRASGRPAASSAAADRAEPAPPAEPLAAAPAGPAGPIELGLSA
jgi:cyclic-di-GMP phosphodiesterase, flagellum assembly factor TipF